ncbi:MAG: GEVED domain-containing protein, partial [Planctomycetota bacterium]
ADDGIKIPLNLPHCRRTRFDYIVTVTHPIDELYVNVWFDWNRDGDWDDVMDCGIANDISNKPRGLAREWAVRNQVLTHLAAGIHKITTPAFMPYHPFRHFADVYRVDPIWMRITISERPWGPVAISNTYRIGTGGSGSTVGSGPNVSLGPKGGAGPRGGYKIGETEDYFFIPTTRCVQEADLNCSRAVDFTDFAAFASQWLTDSP